jgi:hypothetical protein
MGAFALGHSLRRHQPSFAGIHQVTIFRLDATDRVWWCDPLAPAVGYIGEWVSKAQFAAYVNAFAANGHTVAPLQEDSMTTIELTPFPEGPRLFSIAPGATVSGYSPTSATPVKTQTFASGSSASAKGVAVITQVPLRAPQGTFYLGSNGVYAGLYIPISQVTLAPAPPAPAPDCSAVEAVLAQTKAELVAANTKINDLTVAFNSLTGAISVKNAALDAAVLHEKSHVDLSAALQAARSK